jgi:hypothetical protein
METDTELTSALRLDELVDCAFFGIAVGLTALVLLFGLAGHRPPAVAVPESGAPFYC